VGTEGNKFDDTSKFTMTPAFSADWISRHGNSSEIIFIDVGKTFFSKTEILQDVTDVDNLLAAFTGSHVFSFESRKSDGDLTV